MHKYIELVLRGMLEVERVNDMLKAMGKQMIII